MLRKILSECQDVLRYTDEAGEIGFFERDVFQKATAMSLLNIGEHANALTREIWAEHPDIQWRKIVDLRNIVAHGYGELRMELVWNLSKKEIPKLAEQIEKILSCQRAVLPLENE